MRRARERQHSIDRRLSVSEAELQLYVRTADVEERCAVEALLLLRLVNVLGVEVAVINLAGVAPHHGRGFADAAVTDQIEAAVDLRPHAGQVEARSEDLRVFQFVNR